MFCHTLTDVHETRVYSGIFFRIALVIKSLLQFMYDNIATYLIYYYE